MSGKWTDDDLKPEVQQGVPVASDDEVEIDMLAELVAVPGRKPEKSIDRLVGAEIAKGFLSILSGYGGLGKSTLLYALSAGAANGSALVGNPVHGQFRVLYLQMEDDQDMVDRALYGCFETHSVSRYAIEDRFVAVGCDSLATLINMKKGFQYVIPDTDGSYMTSQTMRRRLVRVIREAKADVVVIDPLAALFGGAVMGNEAVNILARDLASLAKELDVAIVCTSHQRKPSGAQNTQSTQHDVKHGSELVDTARSVINLMPLSRGQIDQWSTQVDEDDLDAVRQAVVTKTNIGKTGARFYFRLGTVMVPCRDGKSEQVAVVHHWMPPDVQRTAERWMVEQIAETLANEFVIEKRRGAARNRDILQVLQELDQNLNARDVWADMKAQGWLIVRQERDPGSTNRGLKNRVVVGS